MRLGRQAIHVPLLRIGALITHSLLPHGESVKKASPPLITI